MLSESSRLVNLLRNVHLAPFPGGHPHRDPHPLERLHLLHDQLLHRVRRGQVGLQQLNDLRERLAGDAVHLQVL